MTDANFSAALSTWKEINLSELQKSLDATAVELVDNQKENMVGRKKLAEQTREFKKLPENAEKFSAIKVLLKAYQGEIDNLTRRSKMSETSFLNVYKLLSDAPDPYPLLDAAVDQTVKVAEARMMEAEMARLKEENADLKKQVAEASTAEDKRKKAEQRAEQLEAKMDDLIQERVTQKENELNAEYDERMRNYEDSCATSTRPTRARRLSFSTLASDKDVTAKLAELDLVVADLNRANERVATIERRNEILRSEIETVRSGSQQAEKVKQQEDQIAELEAEASRLLRALEAAKDAKTDVEKSEKKRVDDAAREIATQAAEIENLRAKVKQYSDYDELKRELEIMKFSGADLDADDEVALPDPNADVSNKKLGQSLENLLVSKNRRLLEDLTKLRVAHDELTTQFNKSEESVQSDQEEIARLRQLNERLEADLMSVNKENEKSDKGAGLAGLDIGGKSERTESPSPNNDASILPIVTSQRDRFRQRNAELEEELRRQFETISDLRTEIKSLQADNLKLYEKVRYMQSYRDTAGSSSHMPLSGYNTPGSSASMLNGALRSRDDEIGKYKDKYDESLNPFEAFKGREAQRAIQALNPLERATFALTRAIIGNKRARSLFIIVLRAVELDVVSRAWGASGCSD
ncbi:vacuole transport-related protein [Trichosporon asahii var. asahii CBS 8904]|uniref:Protein CASP n=1 Tax=Trichosporon asahii var. asahii (strain CBS 8904) TaxID=1220162 RepID=K1VEX3_TRIAC|nr:vacuole transport-related protein [Trichosporon asahii var. asahii CBS 8904]